MPLLESELADFAEEVFVSSFSLLEFSTTSSFALAALSSAACTSAAPTDIRTPACDPRDDIPTRAEESPREAPKATAGSTNKIGKNFIIFI